MLKDAILCYFERNPVGIQCWGSGPPILGSRRHSLRVPKFGTGLFVLSLPLLTYVALGY